MSKKTLILLVLSVAIISLPIFYFSASRKSPDVLSETIVAPKEIVPSESSIVYTDPSGFSFSYPDNISLSNKTAAEDSAEMKDPNSYADIQLFSKDKSGSINIKIADSKFKSLDEWLKSQNIPESNIPADKLLGGLKAREVKTSDRLMLASIDQGVLFTIEVPRVEEVFWTKVYNRVLENFAFKAPETAAAKTDHVSDSEVVFEGEEVVE